MFVKYMVVTAILFTRDSMLSYRVEYTCRVCRIDA